jgi:hypothetical protein
MLPLKKNTLCARRSGDREVSVRRYSLIIAATMLATPALADTIVQGLPAVQAMGDFTPYNIEGALFNPTLGTLTAVTATLTGTYTPAVFEGFGSSPGTLVSSYFLFGGDQLGPDTFSGNLPSQTVTPTCASPPTDCRYSGNPTAFSQNFTFSDLDSFISAPSGPAIVSEFGFKSNVIAGGGGGSDFTSFAGTYVLTYTYQVPEPASLGLLSAGLALVLLLRRRNVT